MGIYNFLAKTFYPFLIKVAHADVGGVAPGGGINIPNPLCPGGNCTITSILRNITGYLILIGAPLTAIMIIWGAFNILTAGGDVKKVEVGRKTIVYAAVGYGIVLVSWGAISLIKELLGA